MIICASRRTDIPAFHSEWFMNRMRAGHCLVRNPVSRTTIHRIDLTRDNVDCILFVSKDPRPMEKHLRELGSMGHLCLFQITLNPYGKDIEPGVPFKADINDSCIRISDRIGRDRMSWRYDPVLYGPRIDSDYHRRKFELMCKEASQWTDRCIFSFVDVYGKLVGMVNNGLFRPPTSAEKHDFLRMASRISVDYGIQLTSCCSKESYERYGIESRACFDRSTMMSLGIPYEMQDVPIRKGCRCVRSIDIGEYDTCAHDCLYCYANRTDPSRRMSRLYSADSELLWGAIMPRDKIVETRGRDIFRIDDYGERLIPLSR